MPSKPTRAQLERRISALENEIGRLRANRATPPCTKETNTRQNRLNAVFENSIAGIMILKPNGVLRRCNRKMADILGYGSSEEMAGLTAADLSFSGHELLDALEKSRTAPNMIEPRRIECRLKRKDGSAAHCLLSAKDTAPQLPDASDREGVCVAIDVSTLMETRENLNKTAGLIDTMIKSVPFGVIVVGMDRKIVSVNRAGLEMMGYERESEIVGRACHQNMCPADQLNCPVLDLGEKVDRSERILIHKDGRHVPIYKTVIPINLNNRDVLLETFVDITEEKKAREQLGRKAGILESINRVYLESITGGSEGDMAEAFLSAAGDLTRSPFGFIGEIDEKDRFELLALRNRDDGAAPGQRVDTATMLHGLGLGKIRETIKNKKRAVLANNPAEQARKAGTVEGFTELTSFLAAPLCSGGAVEGIIAVAKKNDSYDEEDRKGLENLSSAISQVLFRKRAEEKARAEQARLSAMISSMEEGVVFADADNTVLEANDYFCRLFGIEKSRIVGKKIEDFHSSSCLDNIVARIDSFMNTIQSKPLVVQRHIFERDIVFRMQPIYRDGRYEGVLLNVLNVTEIARARHKAEKYARELKKSLEGSERLRKDLEKAKKKADIANVAKSQFLANMSHEIRTPMNGIIGFTEMLLDTRLDKTQLEFAESIKKSGEGLLALLNDILDFSKIEAGELSCEKIDFDPELLAYDVCELIRPKVGEKPVEILCRINDDIPAYVKGDPNRYRQVLVNLMANASKFTESGEIELSLLVGEETEKRLKLHAAVRDTGPGIPADKIESIFEPFQQADGSTTRKHGGTGLGLSICRQIARLFDGEVWVESLLNRGSTFHFSAWMEKSGKKAAHRLPPISLEGRKALIVDDNDANLELLAFHLQRAGFSVVACKSGEKALELLRTANAKEEIFDLCVCDIQMPAMSGYRTAEKIRLLPPPAGRLALIALSSMMDMGAKNCAAAGFDGFLTKPVRGNKLHEMAERLLRRMNTPGLPDRTEKPAIMTRFSVREQIKQSVKILLAEDNPVNQKLATMMLRKAGYIVEIAENGKEAVEKYIVSPENFDLIFMDIQMPVMDGLEAAKTIRDLGFDKVPIVAMTANAMKGDRETCLRSGMDDYVSKPIKRDLVFNILEKWVFDKD